MIKSFRDKNTEKVFLREKSRRYSTGVQRMALRKMLILDAAESLDELRVPPGNRLEKLSGNRRGQQSIRVNDQWRICFRWSRGHAYEVEMADYH
jgi:proteic killer suppression protein